MAIDYEFLIELGLVLGFVSYGIKKVSEIAGKKVVASAKAKNDKAKDFSGITNLISNVDQIIAQMHKLRADQIKAGAKEDTLKPIDDRLRQLEWIKKNQTWLEPLAPYGDEIASIALSTLKRVLKAV